LALDKGEAAAEFEDEGFELAQDGGFEVCFVVALAQAEEVEEVRVLEDGRVGFGCARGGGALCAGDFTALEGLAFDLPCSSRTLQRSVMHWRA
jgi:hypothetical protein